MTSFVPEIYGKYLLLDQIASGGMAELYRAKITGAKGFEKLIAIKRILFHLNDDKELVDAFIAEAKLAAFMHHQNIVQVNDFGCVDNKYFMAMEYLSGQDLRFLVNKIETKGKPLPVSIAVYIVACICSGMDYAHRLKDYQGNPLSIIHRDIGPQNIFITYDGDVKIIDFGIAKAATHQNNTQLGIIKGKVGYMSPEQARGETIDSRSDIFSIGVILYELLTGKKMYEGETFKVYDSACHGTFTPAADITGTLPQELYQVLDKALAVDRSCRYQSAREMFRDIDKCMQNHSMGVSPHVLSTYMYSAFADEAKEETIAARKAAGITEDDCDLETNNEDALYEDSPEIPEKIQQKGSRTGRYEGVLIGIFLSLFVVYFVVNVKAYWQLPWVETVLSKISPELVYDNSDDIINHGRRLMSNLKYEEAVTYFRKYFDRDTQYKNKIKPFYEDALLEYAMVSFDKEPEKSARLLHQIIAINESHAKALFWLGKYHNIKKEYDRALSYYEKALETDRNNPEILFNMGYIYAIKEDYIRAEKMFGTVVGLEPIFLDEALVNLAIVQTKQGNNAEAIKHLDKALKINPENRQAKRIRLKL